MGAFLVLKSIHYKASADGDVGGEGSGAGFPDNFCAANAGRQTIRGDTGDNV